MQVYISSYEHAEAREIAAQLRACGHVVTSAWLDEKPRRTTDLSPEERASKAEINIMAVCNSDALVLLTSYNHSPGGNMIEAGAALGMGIPIVLLGQRSNMMLWHPDVYPTTPAGVAHTLATLSENEAYGIHESE